MGRSLLRRLALLLLLAVTTALGGNAPPFTIRMVKIGGTFDHADVRAHLEFCDQRGFNAVWVYTGQAGRWKKEAAPDGPEIFPSFLDLVQWCREHDWRIFVSINPVADAGGAFVFSDPDGARRIRKFIKLLRKEAGVRDFVLSFDDQPLELLELSDVLTYGRSSAPAHLDLARKVARAVPRRGSYWMCASAYCDRHLGDGTGPYSSALLAGLSTLPSRTGIVWTGPSVISQSITEDDLKATRRRLGGRELLLYDNYPVNDNHQRTALGLVLGPLRERAPKLSAHSEVYLSAPMTELGASRLALATVADYLSDPVAYDSEASWESAMRDLGGDDPETLHALDTQALEWGGWIGDRNYRFNSLDNIDTAVKALEDPAVMVRWEYVVRRYPQRIEALRGLRDPLFREPLTYRMEARLAVGRAILLVAELRSAPIEGRAAIIGRLASLRTEVADQVESPRMLDLFLEAVGLSLPSAAPDVVAP